MLEGTQPQLYKRHRSGRVSQPTALSFTGSLARVCGELVRAAAASIERLRIAYNQRRTYCGEVSSGVSVCPCEFCCGVAVAAVLAAHLAFIPSTAFRRDVAFSLPFLKNAVCVYPPVLVQSLPIGVASPFGLLLGPRLPAGLSDRGPRIYFCP